MKYELPDDLKRHYFPCDKAQTLTTYRGCKRRCPDTFRQCWEQHLREDLDRDCAVENERKARSYVTCSHCGVICDIGLEYDRFLCPHCGNSEYCDADNQKELMGDRYLEICESELNNTLKLIRQ